MKIGDLVRRTVESNGERLHSLVGIVVEVLVDPKTNELYKDSVWKVSWSGRNEAYAISENKLELLSENW
jgi:hypothetical protein